MAAILLTLPSFATPAVAYTDSISSFSEGRLGAAATLSPGALVSTLASINIPRGAAVINFSLQLSGASATLTDSSEVGFENGTLSGGATLKAGALTMRTAYGSTEFAASALSDGTFVDTALSGDAVVLTSNQGTYTTPTIEFDGASYGRLIANISLGIGGQARFDVLAPNGTLLASDVKNGALIPVDGALHPSIKLRATLERAGSTDTPRLYRIGAGHFLTDYLQPGAASIQLSSVTNYVDAYELSQDWMRWRERDNNPAMEENGNPWWDGGVLLGSAVAVGRELWMYVHSGDKDGDPKIGRMVSSDGGKTWAVDALPLLNRSASDWDSAYVGIPTVVVSGGQFKMWYMGASTWEEFQIGYATSPDGITWTKHASNPILTPTDGAWDAGNVGWPNVIKVGQTYYMAYSGRTDYSALKSTGLATSSDGVMWTKHPNNPVIDRGDTSYGGYETVASELYYRDGQFYLLWTCSSGSATYNTCLSTSTDAVEWKAASNNPAFTTGDDVWDDLTAELATFAVDPTSGRVLMWVTGRPSHLQYALGIADPLRAATGSYRADWNLSDEPPHAIWSHEVSASVPSGTHLNYSLQSSHDGVTFGAAPSQPLGNLSRNLPSTNFLRHSLNFSSDKSIGTPGVYSTRIGYDVFARAGQFTSEAFATASNMDSAGLIIQGDFPTGTSVRALVSADNGTTWMEAPPGVSVAFTNGGTSLRYRLVLQGTTAVAPLVTRVVAVVGYSSYPSDVRLEDGQGHVLASTNGTLHAPRNVSVDPQEIDPLLRALANASAGGDLSLELKVRSATPGVVLAGNLLITLLLGDVFIVSWLPLAENRTGRAGDSLEFRALVTATPGINVEVNWTVDGIAAGQGETFTYRVPEGGGTHYVRSHATDGNQTFEEEWIVVGEARGVTTSADAGFWPFFIVLGIALAAVAGVVVLQRLRSPRT